MASKLEDRDRLFHSVWLRFNANVGSLLMFSREVSTVADRLDRAKIYDMAADLPTTYFI
jgi:hypothetical protein